MTDHRLEGPGENGAPVPRDMPDQQAGAGEDPWDVAPGPTTSREDADGDDARADGRGADADPADVPDTDVAGTGRRGAPRSGAADPDHPVPDEPSD
ncbi:hypothetical protein SUDANB6_00361 [Streptomyces sp. enrichment culture]|uniref:hypothetical protein n=1 Tax=Streptomyces sp. enrichment culture TaxID=1795815 RepID=UPI003F5431EE